LISGPELRPPRPRDPIRTFARLACFALALIGAVPLAFAALLASPPVERWAAEQTAAAVQRELGIVAAFEVRVRLLPLRLSVEKLRVPATDGGEPFLVAKSASVAPRFFSLLAGRLDLGEIEIEAPKVRAVIKDGKLANLRHRTRDSAPRERPNDAPFTALSLSDGQLEVQLDGVKVNADAIDLDVFAERGLAFEVALRTGSSRIVHRHERLQLPKRESPPWVNEDALCRVDLRLRYEPDNVLIRRLSLLGSADLDSRPGTLPSCDGAAREHPGQVLARLSQVRLVTAQGKSPLIDGHVVARIPVPLTNRYVAMSRVEGHVAFAGDVRWDGSRKLPELRGKLTGAGLKLDVYALAEKLEADLVLQGDEIGVPRFYMRFADGDVHLQNGLIKPLSPGAPISVERVDGKGMKFHSMMRDLNVTPNTIVHWNLTTTKVTKIGGTLSPLKIDADLFADTHDFEVFDRAYHDPARQHMIGIKAGTVQARLGVRPHAFEIYDARTHFGKSAMLAKLVSIRFVGEVELDVGTLTEIDLSDISPLTTIPLSGRAVLDAKMSTPGGDPTLLGNVKIDDFVIGGFPIGDIESGKAKFKPLWVEFSDMHVKKNASRFQITSGKLDFGASASLQADVAVKSEAMDLRDFFAMWHFDEDPRFDDVKGKLAVDARVHYALGGPEDRCGGGVLRTQGRAKVLELDLFSERYDGGEGEFHFDWFDRDATIHGVNLDVPALTLRKGSGTILGSFGLRRGARVFGSLHGTELPLSKLDALPAMLKAADGRLTASAELTGSLDALAVQARARMSEVRLGRATFGPSDLRLRLEPQLRESPRTGTTKCGGPVYGPFDKAEYAADRSSGTFHVDGKLLGGQVELIGLEITRQRRKTTRGRIELKGFELGAPAELLPQVALADLRPTGKLTASIQLEHLSNDDPAAARASLDLHELELEYAGYGGRILRGAQRMTLGSGRLLVPGLAVELKTPRGQSSIFDISSSIDELGANPRLEAQLTMRPLPLGGLLGMLPRVERAEGSLSGKLRLTGPLAAPRYEGGFEIEGGEVVVRGLSPTISDISLAIALDGSEINIVRGSARLGSGSVTLSGGAPLNGFRLGTASARLTLRNLTLPNASGIRATVDADLLATLPAASESGERRLPRLSGDLSLKSFEYRRPVVMTADIASITQRGKRSEFEAYDPSDEGLELDIAIRSERPLKLQNNLIEAELLLDERGLQLAGTNTRFGLRGDVGIKPGGRIKLRRSEFEIQEGRVRFDDVTRIAPRVDVRAVTEYRRYSTSAQASAAPATTGAGAGTSVTRGGRFRITMHAHGDADKLKIDLTSDPALAQDDIFLLITVGLTRAELDQAQSASVGESVALEALGTLTGADRAVTDAVPIIDELRFGSAYSSRTGRTEPTVTIGKRLAERIRANVTSGVAESREIRSNVEWRLSPRVSVEGSYDNVNDISSSSLGNLGADVRWRMEFE
jgi:translocation and assembly module TamB